jgi:hypothetical protein
MEKSLGLFFHLKKENKNYKGNLPVYMRITVNGIYCEISTKRKCCSLKWNVYTGRVDGKSDSAKAFNYPFAFLKAALHSFYIIQRSGNYFGSFLIR